MATQGSPQLVDLTIRQQPHFKSSYAPLEDVLSAAPALLKRDRHFNRGHHRWRTLLLRHHDHPLQVRWMAQQLFPVTDPAPQKVGGCETYAQRYNVRCRHHRRSYDDGNTASGIKTKRDPATARQRRQCRIRRRLVRD